MGDLIAIIAVAAGAFIATNLDNFLLLVTFYSAYKNQSGWVTAGYFTGMIIIGLLCFVIGEAGEAIPFDYLGYLGVIPMGMGVVALFRLYQQSNAGETTVVGVDSRSRAVFVTVLTTQLSNSADSIITFSVFQADSSDHADYLVAATFLAMTGVFALLANYALKHPKVSDILARFGAYVTPFILILVGAFILSNTGADLMPG